MMNDTTASADLTLGITDHVKSDADFVGLRAAVVCRGFSGRTEFTIARRDVRRFVAEVADVSSHASDSAMLLGGWDRAEQRLRLQIARAGLSGQFIARVRIATNGPRVDQWNRVETEYVASREAIAGFMSGLESLASGPDNITASLVGDADAIE